MTALTRRLQAKRPLPAADVADRIQVRAESVAFEASPVAQLSMFAGVREWSQACDRCGSVQIFHGTLDTWIDRAITFDDTHACGDVA